MYAQKKISEHEDSLFLTSSSCVERQISSIYFLHLNHPRPPALLLYLDERSFSFSIFGKREKKRETFLMYAATEVAWCTNACMRALMNSLGCGKSRKQISFEEFFVYFYFAPLLCKNFSEVSLMFWSEGGRRIFFLEGPIHSHYYNVNLNLPGFTACLLVLEEHIKKRKLLRKLLWITAEDDFLRLINYLRDALNHESLGRNKRLYRGRGKRLEIRNLQTVLTPKEKKRTKAKGPKTQSYVNREEFLRGDKRYFKTKQSPGRIEQLSITQIPNRLR